MKSLAEVRGDYTIALQPWQRITFLSIDALR
jgi:hypothetical protein